MKTNSAINSDYLNGPQGVSFFNIDSKARTFRVIGMSLLLRHSFSGLIVGKPDEDELKKNLDRIKDFASNFRNEKFPVVCVFEEREKIEILENPMIITSSFVLYDLEATEKDVTDGPFSSLRVVLFSKIIRPDNLPALLSKTLDTIDWNKYSTKWWP